MIILQFGRTFSKFMMLKQKKLNFQDPQGVHLHGKAFRILNLASWNSTFWSTLILAFSHALIAEVNVKASTWGESIQAIKHFIWLQNRHLHWNTANWNDVLYDVCYELQININVWIPKKKSSIIHDLLNFVKDTPSQPHLQRRFHQILQGWKRQVPLATCRGVANGSDIKWVLTYSDEKYNEYILS